ncbi:hypothetical protein [Halanaerobacter jeridensis]|uniref:RanBP2-type domain-containing protein n=1 Tax=Halanaerobacter jeridensis TaxID=706427 RepID=A0A938XU77_9FIRM|nr:hypothetical protein [Halanaerobacter jeridensis]MBM7557628.1 hypothetical protein [Halanaerobacter jeridensis]
MGTKQKYYPDGFGGPPRWQCCKCGAMNKGGRNSCSSCSHSRCSSCK